MKRLFILTLALLMLIAAGCESTTVAHPATNQEDLFDTIASGSEVTENIFEPLEISATTAPIASNQKFDAEEYVFITKTVTNNGDIYQIVDMSGHVLVDEYHDVTRFCQNEFIAKNREFKWVLIDSTGKELVNFSTEIPGRNHLQGKFKLQQIIPTANPDLLIAVFYAEGMGERTKLINKQGVILSEDDVYPGQTYASCFFTGFRDSDTNNVFDTQGKIIAIIPDSNTVHADVSSGDEYACISITEFFPDSFNETFKAMLIDDQGNTIIDFGKYETLLAAEKEGVYIAKELNSNYFQLIDVEGGIIKKIDQVSAVAIINSSHRCNLFYIEKPYSGFYMNAFTGAIYSEEVKATNNPEVFIGKTEDSYRLVNAYGETISKDYLEICQTYYPNVFVGKVSSEEWEVIDAYGKTLSIIKQDRMYYDSFS